MNRFKKRLEKFCISFLRKNGYTFYEKNPTEDVLSILWGGIDYPCFIISRIKDYHLLQDLEHILNKIDTQYKKGISFDVNEGEHYQDSLAWLVNNFSRDLENALSRTAVLDYCEIRIKTYKKGNVPQWRVTEDIDKFEKIIEELKNGS